YMISKLGMGEYVAALLTISTPHRGTPYADWCLKHLGQKLRGMQLARLLHLDIEGLPDLTTESCARFCDETADHPDVKYYSVSAARARNRMPTFALHSHKVISDAEGENDALVSLRSSTYGTSLGTWDADHWQVINKGLPFPK